MTSPVHHGACFDRGIAKRPPRYFKRAGYTAALLTFTVSCDGNRFYLITRDEFVCASPKKAIPFPRRFRNRLGRDELMHDPTTLYLQ